MVEERITVAQLHAIQARTAVMHTWKFITTTAKEQTAWCWVHCVERRVLERTAFAFRAFPDCVADARSHGFDVSQRFDVLKDRRKTARLAA
jgi:hypothetical protein